MITSQGYVAVRVPPTHRHAWGNGRTRGFAYAYEHILVAEEQIGRPMTPREVAHHRNGQRDDNRPENIEVVTASSHMRHHSKRRRRGPDGRFLGGAA
jgi:hypothetical protein